MSDYPADLRYTNDHEWVRPDGARWRVGITTFAAKQLGDIVMAELPKVGTVYSQGDSFGTLESVKAVSELFMPASGKVVAVNEELAGDPEVINTDPYGEGWLIEIEPSSKSELDELMKSDAYAKHVAEADS